jgi:hypothetical protein
MKALFVESKDFTESVKRLYLLDVYDKDEQDDLSAQEKKVLADLARALKKEAVGRRGQGT